MPGPAGGPLTWGRRRSVVLPLAVLGGELLLALAHRLQGVLRLLPGLVRTQPVALGAAVARLDGVVLETEEPGPSGHQQPPRAVGSGRGPPCHRPGRAAQGSTITWSCRA